ncbi:dixin [Ciona intestinalis]
MDIQEQVQAYTAWVNSQLKKRGQKIVNLGEDLKDGVALVAVVEIVSGHTLGGIKPTCENEKRENVSKVLQFMRNAGIKLHHVTVDEITSGNVKTMMQLILALAAHFKPASIGGRKVESPRQHTEASVRIKQRWRDSRVKEAMGKHDLESSMQADVERELATIRDITQSLQKVLLEEIPGQPLEGHDADEQNVIIQARLDQANVDKVNLEEENHIARQENRKILSEKSALEQRFLQQEEELLSIRQQLLHSNLSRDKLQSEKGRNAELITWRNSRNQRNQDELEQKCRPRSEHGADGRQAIQNKINHSREIRKLDKELHFARQESYNGQTNDSVFHDKPIIRSGERLSMKIAFIKNQICDHSKRSISKRVGDITLGEFKTAIKKEGNYRFIFKALDPELGTVKEEVFHDDDVIPGWEGKIVAWVEEVLRV